MIICFVVYAYFVKLNSSRLCPPLYVNSYSATIIYIYMAIVCSSPD